MKALLLLFAVPLMVIFGACPPTPVVPPNDASDASDAATADATPPAIDVAPPVSDATPAPDAGPTADAAPATPCQAACDTLRKLGCSEGAAQNCLQTLQTLQGPPALVRVPSGKPFACACVSSATSAAGERACGVACQ